MDTEKPLESYDNVSVSEVDLRILKTEVQRREREANREAIARGEMRPRDVFFIPREMIKSGIVKLKPCNER